MSNPNAPYDPIGPYKIIRSYAERNRPADTIKTGLTLAEARAHCQDPKTIKKGVWRDSFTRQGR